MVHDHSSWHGGGSPTNKWAVLEPLLPKGTKAGRPPVWPRRQLIDGIRIRVRTGVPWRDVPVEYGPWGRIYDLFRRWQRDGTADGRLRRPGVGNSGSMPCRHEARRVASFTSRGSGSTSVMRPLSVTAGPLRAVGEAA
ncbi:transposase [Streptomyces eurythermus]